MAPDKNNGHGKTDKILKAVILADAFNDLFQPLSLNKPRCLLPLCNVPMIEYTLEFLASSGVKETLVVCKSHVDAIKEYLWQSKWASSLSTMKIKTSVVKSANTLGEALRELDETPFVSDFILCTGVVIANINIADIVNMHVENPDKDKVVTMVLQETTSEHRARDKSEEVVYVIEPRTNRLLTLDSATTLPETKIMDLPLEVITDHPEIEIRNDLMDTNVYVCSPKIFALFKDSFDYQTMRSDFIQKTSISELESATFYAHVLEGTNGLHAEAPRAPINKTSASAGRGRGDKGSAKTEDLADDSAAFTNHSGYLAGVVDTSAYDAISRDLIARWAYPLCPDSNPVDPLTYSYYRGAVYKAESVVLARESRVDHHVILGTNSKVADFARVSNAVLGADCSIGERSIVRGSYLFEGAQVGRNSVVEGCILGERAVILDNVILERGCIIGDDVVIGPNVRLAPFTRIGRWMQEMVESDFSDISSSSSSSSSEDSDDSDDDDDDNDDDDDSDDDADESHSGAGNRSSGAQEGFDIKLVGEQGVGYLWNNSVRSEDNDTQLGDVSESYHRLQRQLHSIGSTLRDLELAKQELLAEEQLEEQMRDQRLAQKASSKAGESEESFEIELRLTIQRSFENDHEINNVAFELNNVRFTFNGKQKDVRRVITQEILRTIDVDNLQESARARISRWGDLIKRTIETNVEQIDVLDTTERYCALEPSLDSQARGRMFALVVKYLYEMEVIEDVAIVYWHNKAQEKKESEVSMELVHKIDAFVEWLEEEDDSDEDDDEDDSEEDDDDESEEESD